jgi:hypothetical protein
MAEKNIECKVVKVLTSSEAGGGTNQVRIVRWIVDGKDTGALLEKRNFFQTKGGEEKMGKAKGFNLTDLSQIVENWAEIKPLM